MKILVPGGGGYIGAVLVPWLLADGHIVTVYDTMWFGKHWLSDDNSNLTVINNDIRSVREMNAAAEGQDAVICLAAISAEAMCQRNPILANTVNMGGAMGVALSAKRAGIEKFIYASSVAGYPSSEIPCTEIVQMDPTTLYGKGKVDAEKRVLEVIPDAVITRSASVCGYSPNQKFHITVNTMVRDAVMTGVITVEGGSQKRSHIHIQDICDFYRLLLNAPSEKIRGQAFNVVAENATVAESASLVASETGARIEIKPRSDVRSYSVDGTKAKEVLGFTPKRAIREAVIDLKARFDSGMWKDALTNEAYMNRANLDRATFA